MIPAESPFGASIRSVFTGMALVAAFRWRASRRATGRPTDARAVLDCGSKRSFLKADLVEFEAGTSKPFGDHLHLGSDLPLLNGLAILINDADQGLAQRYIQTSVVLSDQPPSGSLQRIS